MSPSFVRWAAAGRTPALAYDFSSVPVTQIPNAIDAIQKKIAVADAIATDQILPPSAFAKYIAPGLTLLAEALNALIAGSKRSWTAR